MHKTQWVLRSVPITGQQKRLPLRHSTKMLECKSKECAAEIRNFGRASPPFLTKIMPKSKAWKIVRSLTQRGCKVARTSNIYSLTHLNSLYQSTFMNNKL